MKNHIILAAPTTCHRCGKEINENDTAYAKWDEASGKWKHQCLGCRRQRAAEVEEVCAIIEREKYASEAETDKDEENENAGRCENHPPR